jgi:hypothetical protein
MIRLRPLWLLAVFVFGLGISSPYSEASEDCRTLLHQLMAQADQQTTRAQVSLSESLIDVHSDLAVQVERLHPSQVNYSQFIQEFMDEHGRGPTLREAIEYSYSMRRELHQSYDDVFDNLSSIGNRRLSDFIDELDFSRGKLPKFADLDQLESEILAQVDAGRAVAIRSIDDEIPLVKNGEFYFFDEDYWRFLNDRTGIGNYLGEYGELVAMVQTRGQVLKRGLKFDVPYEQAIDPYQQEIALRLRLLKENLEEQSVDQISALINIHTNEGTGLLRFAREYLEQTPPDEFRKSDLIEKILGAIRAKEIDIVSREANGKIVWSEVKAYQLPITLTKLTENGRRKTIYEQLVEHKSVAHLLGLEGRVEFRFVSPLSAVEPDAKRLLEALGYTVIDSP